MKAVFEVEHERGRTFLVTWEVTLAKQEIVGRLICVVSCSVIGSFNNGP